MGVALLDLVETARRVAKQALGKRAGKPDSGANAVPTQHLPESKPTSVRFRPSEAPLCGRRTTLYT